MLSIILEAAIRSLILGGVAWTALACLRARNPITRLTVWTGLLYVAIAMPLLVVARHALLPAMPVLPAVPLPPSVDAMIAAPVSVSVPMPSGAGALPAGAGAATYNLLPVILAFHGTITFLLLLRLGIGLMRGWGLKRRALPLGSGHYKSGEVTTPLVFGSAIILPVDFAKWPEAKRAAVLAHERSHIARGDYYTQLLAGVHRALFWFSPLGWWLHRELAALAELASDDAAAEAHGNRLSYAEILIEVARDARPLAGAVAIARGPKISTRIGRLVSGAALSMSLSHRQRALIGSAGTLVVLAALTATVATSSVARTPGPPSASRSHLATLMSTLATLDKAPAQLADAVGALLQRTPPAAAAPGARQTDASTGATPADPLAASGPRPLGPESYIIDKHGWGGETLVNREYVKGVVTEGELLRLSPREAGERMLGQLAHGPVAKVSVRPKLSAVRLVEEWTRVPEGCQRLEWTGQFLPAPNGPEESAWLSQAYAFPQIAMAEADGCASARYALLGAGMDREKGFKALTAFEEAVTGKRAVTFDCKSPAGRDICSNPQAIRAELLRPVHRVIQMAGAMMDQTDPRINVVYNSAGFDGALMYMKVTFDPRRPDQIIVEDLPHPSANRTTSRPATPTPG